MHINAPIQVTGDGTRWSMCAKCRKVFGLSEGFVEGSHLCCGGCGQNLLLKKMSMVEWEALAEQYPQPLSPVMTTMRTPHGVNDYALGCECPGCCQFREQAKAIGCTPFDLAQEMAKFLADHFKLPTSTIGEQLKQRAAVSALYNVPVLRLLSSPSTAEAENEIRAYHIELAMGASQRNEKLKQELIRQYTNAAAYKLGRISKRMQQRDQAHANMRKKEIKDTLATNLIVVGIPYREIETIIRELVEGLKNV